jgi:hypothetical protein
MIASLLRGPILADGVHVAVELVERGVRQPRFVEVQRLDRGIERRLQHLDVVGDAVVGALGERQDARLLVFRLAARTDWPRSAWRCCPDGTRRAESAR